MENLSMNKFIFFTLIVILCLFLFLQKSFAASLEENERALKIIADFADQFCKEIPLRGHGDNLELTGSAKAELNGIIKKLANLGIEGAVKYQDTDYEGLLQKDLVSVLIDGTNCRLQIWNDLKNKLISPNISTPDRGAKLPKEWPLVGEETFTEISPGWTKGNFADQNLSRFNINFVGGNYRWDMEFIEGKERWVEAPYGPATDFYLAVDVRFVAHTHGSISAGLLFGHALNKDYSFKITSNKKFGLSRFDGTRNEMIISYTPTSINPKESNRIAVAVQDQQINLYINSKLVGEYKDYTFTGGKVGMSVTGWQLGQATVIDFDNFEFRRRP